MATLRKQCSHCKAMLSNVDIASAMSTLHGQLLAIFEFRKGYSCQHCYINTGIHYQCLALLTFISQCLHCSGNVKEHKIHVFPGNVNIAIAMCTYHIYVVQCTHWYSDVHNVDFHIAWTISTIRSTFLKDMSYRIIFYLEI